MKFRFLLIIILLAILSTPVLSQEIYQYNINAEIFEDRVEYELNLIITNYPQKFSVYIESPENLMANFSSNCTIESNDFGASVTCDVRMQDRIIIKYYSTQDVNNKDTYSIYSKSFKVPVFTRELFVLVKIPERTGLRRPTEISYSPQGALIGSDGRRPILIWKENNLNAGEAFDVQIAFEPMFGELNLPIIILIVIILVSGFILYYKFFLKGGIKVILPILKKDEKAIFECMMKHGSGVNQKTIVKESNYSKAKVSKVLKSLQERGIIKLERIGRSNKVYLVKDFEKKK